MKLRIGCHDWTFRVLPPKDRKRNDGMCRPKTLSIEVDPEIPPTRQAEIAWHEVLHALYFEAGLEGTDNEEVTVTYLARGLASFIHDNPAAVAAFQAAGEGAPLFPVG